MGTNNFQNSLSLQNNFQPTPIPNNQNWQSVRRLTLSGTVSHLNFEPTLNEGEKSSFFSFKSDIPGVSDSIFKMALVLNWNAIVQCTADVVIELLMLAKVIPGIEFRVAFLFLTFLSALLAVHSLTDIRSNELDTTVQAVRISFVVEFGLVLEDLFFIFNAPDAHKRFWRTAYRIPFLTLTCMNICLLLAIGFKLNILTDVFGISIKCGHEVDTVLPLVLDNSARRSVKEDASKLPVLLEIEE
jgi:hypothetical protein